MQVASVGQNVVAPQQTPERTEGPGPDRDHDGDESRTAAVKSLLSSGVGKQLDTTA